MRKSLSLLQLRKLMALLPPRPPIPQRLLRRRHTSFPQLTRANAVLFRFNQPILNIPTIPKHRIMQNGQLLISLLNKPGKLNCLLMLIHFFLAFCFGFSI